MKSIQEEQLTILAEKLSKIKAKQEKLKNDEDKIREIAFSLMKQSGLLTQKSHYGKFVVCNGKTTKNINDPKYLAAEKTLKSLKTIAIEKGNYDVQTGDKYLRFDPAILE
jgi:hypothetical protein